MCGIAGYWDTKGNKIAELRATVAHMTAALHHRGPDDGGLWTDDSLGLGLGHRRLSIVDLSREGSQPMVSASGRFITVFNGEIYNFQTLKKELEVLGHHFRGRSDTEVLLASMDEWGLDRSIAKLAGMFAFALWDIQTRTLHLVRDRLGKKPLYFGWLGSSFVFASELKSITLHPEFDRSIDRAALSLFVQYGYVPAPATIYRTIFKLPAGALISLRGNQQDLATGRELLGLVRPYWSARSVTEQGLSEPPDLGDEEALDELDALLGAAVSERMIADVPLGAFLSGGLDSSLIVALMQKRAAQPVKTFSIGFNEAEYNEAADARRVADCLGTDHTEFFVSADEACGVLPDLPTIYDEPFADPSQIPTVLLSRLTRARVTVALSGDGGDELFGGYNRYLLATGMHRKLLWVSLPFRTAAASALTAVPARGWDVALSAAHILFRRWSNLALPGDRLHELANAMLAPTPAAMYRSVLTYWSDTPPLVDAVLGSEGGPLDASLWSAGSEGLVERLMAQDLASYLPDGILTKVDRASMSVGLEVRAPLLDHRVAEFACRLPSRHKFHDGRGKWILRKLLARHLPSPHINRPKQGFGIPISAWLRGPLQDWAEELLDARQLKSQGFFEPQLIRQRWLEHLSGKRNWGRSLWSVLTFQAWRDCWL
jgi:asparagine synthase (glutamine-hydrolysing)